MSKSQVHYSCDQIVVIKKNSYLFAIIFLCHKASTLDHTKEMDTPCHLYLLPTLISFNHLFDIRNSYINLISLSLHNYYCIYKAIKG